MERLRPETALAMVRQLSPEAPQRVPAQDFGEKGKRAWFWQDHRWQVGRAWSVDSDGNANGMCRDYGDWGVPYPGSAPLETHGIWPPDEVAWKRPASQYEQHASQPGDQLSLI